MLTATSPFVRWRMKFFLSKFIFQTIFSLPIDQLHNLMSTNKKHIHNLINFEISIVDFYHTHTHIIHFIIYIMKQSIQVNQAIKSVNCINKNARTSNLPQLLIDIYFDTCNVCVSYKTAIVTFCVRLCSIVLNYFPSKKIQ